MKIRSGKVELQGENIILLVDNIELIMSKEVAKQLAEKILDIIDDEEEQ